MSVKQVIIQESNTVSNQSVSIPFEFTNKESLPEGKNVGNSIVITPITVRTWFKMKPYFVHIDKEDIDKLVLKQGVEFDSEIRDVINKYDSLLFEIVCIGIHNKKGDMPGWFKNVLMDNCTWEDIGILLNAIIYHIGTTAFMNSITALKNVSPLDEEEIIALQQNKEKWIQKVALRYTHEQTLDSSLWLIMAMFREFNYMQIERSRYSSGEDDLKEGEEWVTITDFESGQPKRVKRVKSI